MSLRKTRRYIVALLAIVMLAACQRGDDFVAPSFLHLESIELVKTPTTTLSPDAGFYTADIVGAYVVAHRPGAAAEDTVGVYRLPFTIPVLYSGDYDYLKVYPAVMQSGSTNAIIPYPFYSMIRLDSISVHSGDTTNLGSLKTTYQELTKYLFYESFEPSEGSIKFDSVMEWVSLSPDEACTGYGYGKVSVPDSVTVTRFGIDGSWPRFFASSTSTLYLELDIKSDVEFQVFMEAPYIEGQNDQESGVMAIYKTPEWKHFYINLGRTWAYHNHNSFRLAFAAFNLDGQGGEVWLDNVRVVVTDVLL